MNLYVESSAVLAWLLEERPGETVRRILAAASRIFTSGLTLIECDRALHRAVHLKRFDAFQLAQIRDWLEAAARQWTVWTLHSGIVERARRSFPREPVRSLDALHLATAAAVGDIQPGLVVLSLDRRVRENAVAMGLAIVPKDPGDGRLRDAAATG